MDNHSDSISSPLQPESPADASAGQNAGCGSLIAGGAALIWIFVITTFVQAGAWAAAQFMSMSVGGGLGDADFLGTLFQAFMLLIPLTLLAHLWRDSRYRLLFRLWWLAAIFSLMAALIHLPGAIAGYTSGALQIAVCIAFIVLLRLDKRRQAAPTLSPQHASSALPVSLAVSPFLLMPWVAAGAPGAPLEVALNLLASILFGLCAALLLRGLAGLAAVQATPDARSRLLGGLVAAGILAPMASSYGFGGVQLLMLFALPAAGWLAMSIVGRRHSTAALAILVGLAAAGPLIFIDPREVAVALSFALFSTLVIAGRAALLTALLALLGGAAVLVLQHLTRSNALALEPRRPRAAWLWTLLIVPAWLGLLLFLVFTDSPGFHGDHLFVVLREQADVSQAATLANVEQRRAHVYDTLVSHAVETQGELRAALDRWNVAYTPYYLVNGIEVQGGPLLRAWLQRRPEVERVLYSPVLRPAPPEGTDPFEVPEPTVLPWNISLIRADEAWQAFGARGAGVVIGQSDSGVQWDHPQLLDSYRGDAQAHDYNWYDPWFATIEPTDNSGHGTHTLGTVLGNLTGVAPDATWYGCANLGRNLGSAPLYLECMQFMLAPFPLDGDPFRDGDPALGANVLNNSWGCPELEGCDADALLPAIAALRQAGTFLVVSAGNEGPACATVSSPPAIYQQVISVGAVDRFENIAFFSSRGPVEVDGSNRVKPDIMAPGSDVVSAYPGNSYRSLQGTSMAGPHIAGVVALMWSANPQLVGEISATEEILLNTARPLTATADDCGSQSGTVPNNLQGYGLVDAYAAVEQAIAHGSP